MPRLPAVLFASLHRLLCWSLPIGLLLALVAAPAMAQSNGAAAQSGSDGSASGGQADYGALVELLKDPGKRDQLIAELERLSSGSAGQSGKTAAGGSDAGGDGESSGGVGGVASDVVGAVSEGIAEMAGAAGRLFGRDVSVDWLAVGQLAWRVVAALAVAYLVLFVGRLLLRRFWQRLERYAQATTVRHRLFRVGLAVLASLASGVVLVALAYLAAQTSVWWLADEDERIGSVLGLALQAFIVVELARLVIKVAFAPALPGLRLFPLSEEDSRFWSRWLSRVIWLTGYAGIMLVPAIQAGGEDDLARAVGWVVALLALVYTWSHLWRGRHMVRGALTARAERAERTVSSWALHLLGGTWHWLAMLYALGVFVVAIVRPGESLPFVALATFNTAVIVGSAIFIAAMLTQWIGRGVPVPEGLLKRMPTLQLRLNTYVPLILRVIRIVIGLMAFFGLLWAWNLVNVFGWLASEGGRGLLAATIDIAIVLLIALVAWLVATGLIEAKLNSDTGMPSARMQTLLALFRNAIAIALITITAMIILSEIGVNIGPLLAGAGVLGLAIGFGAQKMVQDVITGVFIQIENAIHTGDVVTAAAVTGTVERLSIRSVSLRDLSGTLHVIPFSSVDIVSNYTRDFAFHKGEYGIAYRENVDEAIEQLKAAFDELAEDPNYKDYILEPVEIPGVVALADSSVNIRVMIKTAPGHQWAVGRAYNRLVKMYFDKAGIEIPFPHTTLYFGVEKDGSAPPANLRWLEREPAGDGKAPERSARTGETSDSPHARLPDQDDVDQPET